MQKYLVKLVLSLLLLCAVGAQAREISLSLIYSSEKEKWISEVTEQFNKSALKTVDGSSIKVTATPTGSGDATIKKLLNGEYKAQQGKQHPFFHV